METSQTSETGKLRCCLQQLFQTQREGRWSGGLFCFTLTWIWLRSTAARRIMALARLWNSLPMWSDFSNVVLLWSTSLAYRIWWHISTCGDFRKNWNRHCEWSVHHLAVGVNARIDKPLEYELSELIFQSCYRGVEGLSHLIHICWHVRAEILNTDGHIENTYITHFNWLCSRSREQITSHISILDRHSSYSNRCFYRY